MRAIQTETGISLGRIRGILEAEIEELIGGVDLRELVKNKLFASRPSAMNIDDLAEEGARAAIDIASERPSERAMRLSRPEFDRQQAASDSRAAGKHPPNHSILKSS
jgi:hypothetical protein